MTSQEQTHNINDDSRDEEISEDEANEEIDIPIASFAPPTPPMIPQATKPAATPAPRPAPPVTANADDTTPSVREAIDKAADMMRELRGER